eukprot:TRINITY_DN4837_c0_g1_i1.p1 TRINITY_DN4837_c0_g1~~TRINITY_DN4837_c0_g1_i1.p1  ORF type:complete len:127 (-),score=16.04 TRINITY_DN4837_c0_g1_i1:230-610(-)
MSYGQPTLYVTVTITGADDLPNMDLFGTADPYYILKYNSKEYKSDIRKNTLSPRWEHIISFPMYDDTPDHKLNIKLWDWDKIGKDDYIGEVDIHLPPEYLARKDMITSSYILTDAHSKKPVHIVQI